jgi:hypothetical protein
MIEEEVVTDLPAGTHGQPPTVLRCIYSSYGSTAEWMLYYPHIDTCQVSHLLGFK